MLIQNIKSYDDFTNYMNTYKYIIVNISASWCQPCISIKPHIEKFVSVIVDENDENKFIYLKIDNSVYEKYVEFEKFFKINKIPYFGFIKNNKIVDAFVSGDFKFVSKKIFDNISNEKDLS